MDYIDQVIQLEVLDNNGKILHSIDSPAVSFLGIFLVFASPELNYNLKITWPNGKTRYIKKSITNPDN